MSNRLMKLLTVGAFTLGAVVVMANSRSSRAVADGCGQACAEASTGHSCTTEAGTVITSSNYYCESGGSPSAWCETWSVSYCDGQMSVNLCSSGQDLCGLDSTPDGPRYGNCCAD